MINEDVPGLPKSYTDWTEVDVPWGRAEILRRLTYDPDRQMFYALHDTKGLYSSTNAKDWALFAAGIPGVANYFDFMMVNSAPVSGSNRIYMATDKGLYCSPMTPPHFKFTRIDDQRLNAVRAMVWNGLPADRASNILCGIWPDKSKSTEEKKEHNLEGSLYLSNDDGKSWSNLTYEMTGYPNNCGPDEIIGRGAFLIHTHTMYNGFVYYCVNSVNLSSWKVIELPNFTHNVEIMNVGISGAYAFLAPTAGGLFKVHLTDYSVKRLDEYMEVTAMSRGAGQLLAGTRTEGILRLANQNPPLEWDKSLNATLPKDHPGVYSPVTQVVTDRDIKNIFIEIYGGRLYSGAKHTFLHCSST